MSAWATRRQLSFIAFFIILLAIAVFAIIVSNRKVPTCTDNEQNQGELDIDCGGPCAKVCNLEVSEIVILWTKVFKVREGFYDVAAYIENPNPFEVYKYPFQFRIYDADNIPVKDITGVINLGAHERILIFEPGVNVGFRVPTRAFLSFTEEPLWQRVDTNIELPKLTVTNEKLEGTTGVTLKTDITNESLRSVSNIELAVLLYDEAGNVINVSESKIDQLSKDEKREVVFTWPEFARSKVFSADVIPRVDTQIVNESSL
jgi:hypothetical protein